MSAISNATSNEYSVVFPSGLDRCLVSEEVQHLEAVSAKIQCNVLVEWTRYSVGTVIPKMDDPNQLLVTVRGEFEKIFARKDLPKKCHELHWDIFFETPEHKFCWFRSEYKTPDSTTYRGDQAKPYAAGEFTNYYDKVSTALSSLYKGYKVIPVVDEKGEFVASDGMKVQVVNKPAIHKIVIED